MTNPLDPYFPCHIGVGQNEGITIRGHFASMAMQALLSNSSISESMIPFKAKMTEKEAIDFDTMMLPKIISKTALLHAEALIEELNKEP
jgi:hypothetical protein